MSIRTDVSSLKIFAHIYKENNFLSTCMKTVESLVEDVDYIDYASIYLLKNDQLHLIASSNCDEQSHNDYESELKIAMTDDAEEQFGYLIVRSSKWIAFDTTDYFTLKDLAKAIAKSHLLH